MRNFLSSVSLAVVFVATPAVAQDAQTANGTSSTADVTSSEAGVDDIIVTASRRSDSIRNVPIAVTAVTGDALKAAQVSNLADLAASTPNVQINTLSNNANVTVRGIGNLQITAGADAGVAVQQDGVYIGQSMLTLSTMYDIQRVEVLRGPQGTLFGRNATGGAINILPNEPTEDLRFGVDASFGIDPTVVRSSAYLSGPITDGLLGRLSISQNYNEGFTENLTPFTATNPVPRRLDDVDSVGLRGQLQAEIGKFETRLVLEFSKDQGAGPSIWLNGTPTGNLPAVLAGASLGNVDKREVYDNYGYKNDDAKFATLISSLDVGAGQLKVTASYGDTSIERLTDGDGTDVDHTSTVGNNYANQTFGELLYTSDADKLLSFILGANYFQEDQQQDFSVPISILPPPLDALGAVTVDLGAREIKSESYAAFGQATYRIGDALSVFAGLRYSHDAKSMVSYNNFGVSPATGSGSWSNISYEFGASYRFSPSITGYAKYSTGYKGGGFSAGAAAIPFDPETNSNIELGLKGSYFGGALQANLAAFNMTYDDLQVNQIVGPLVAVTNAAAATINGFEAEIRARPTEKLYVDLNAAYLDAKFDDFFTSDDARPTFQPDTRVINGVVTSGIELAGNRLPNAPEFTASAGLYYEVNLNAGTFTLGGRYDWKSRVYFSEFNLPVASQDAIGKLNLYARYVSEDGRWSAGIFALNVEDKQVISNVVVVSSLIGSLGITRYEPPRQVGVSIGFKY